MRLPIGLTPLTATLLVAGLIGWAGCNEDEIRVYRAPKEPQVSVDMTVSDPAASTPPRQPIQWTVPEGWRRLPGNRPMRVATFEAGDPANPVQIAVSSFPGQVGGLLANVNRWRGQVGLEPIEEADLTQQAVSLTPNGLHGILVDLTGHDAEDSGGAGQRILAAILRDQGGVSWVVKAMDRPSVIDAHKDAIITFIGSFRPGDSGVVQDQQSPLQPDQEPDEITWEKPGHWQVDDVNSSSVVWAAFKIDGPGGQARVTVTALVGDGGGALANLNRWRQQVGLSPVSRIEDQPATHLDVAGKPATLFDLAAPGKGSAGGARILVAVLPRPGRSWFIKLTGPDHVVEDQKQVLTRFVESIQFGS